jgi:hypothetical protein
VNSERRLRVTPAPFGLGCRLWLYGTAGAGCAARYGLSLIAVAEDTVAPAVQAWRRIDSSLGAASLQLRRAAVRTWTGVDHLVRQLHGERKEWGLDTVLVRPCGERTEVVRALAQQVRPRVQLDRLPVGLEEFWTTSLNEAER